MAITKYTLYLDESETHKINPTTSKDEDYHFCMAGIIVANSDYAILENSVNQLKQTLWSELPSPQEIVLHQIRVTEAAKGRLDATKYPEYVKFNSNSERKKLYEELKKLFTNNNLTVIGCSVNEDTIKNYYSVNGRNKIDMSLICMQLILENYCHFLCSNDAIGNVIYESRELKEDERLRDRYYHMKLMGSMYMNKESAEKRLLGIDFVDKSTNNAGLQIADFIPRAFARDHAGINQEKPNIFSTFKYYRYDGKLNEGDRFGVKYMP